MSRRWYSLDEAARIVNLPVRLVLALIEETVIGPVYENRLTYEQVCELRRARRLFSLGLNRAGVVVALRMRRRVLALQREIEMLQAEMASLEAYYEAKQQELHRRLGENIPFTEQEEEGGGQVRR